jgi:5,5'-dehydrodivanillate O-demethylase
MKIRTYPTQEYMGLIFAYLGEGSPPEFRRYPDLDRPGVIVTDPVEILPCSFWNRLDNDHSHIPWVHRATAVR